MGQQDMVWGLLPWSRGTRPPLTTVYLIRTMFFVAGGSLAYLVSPTTMAEFAKAFHS